MEYDNQTDDFNRIEELGGEYIEEVEFDHISEKQCGVPDFSLPENLEVITEISVHDVSGDLDVAKDAIIQVTSRLRTDLFDKEGQGSLPAFLPVLPYLPMSSGGSENLKYENRDAESHGCGYSSGGYGPLDVAPVDTYDLYGCLQSGSGGSAYGSYLSGRSVGSGDIKKLCWLWTENRYGISGTGSTQLLMLANGVVMLVNSRKTSRTLS